MSGPDDHDMGVWRGHGLQMQKSDATVNLRDSPDVRPSLGRQTSRSAIIFFTSATALAGFSPFGQTWAQFMMVWHR